MKWMALTLVFVFAGLAVANLVTGKWWLAIIYAVCSPIWLYTFNNYRKMDRARERMRQR